MRTRKLHDPSLGRKVVDHKTLAIAQPAVATGPAVAAGPAVVAGPAVNADIPHGRFVRWELRGIQPR
ncbi:MAG: hypothetical protein ACK52A_01565, partial [Planctomycetota bacterium]